MKHIRILLMLLSVILDVQIARAFFIPGAWRHRKDSIEAEKGSVSDKLHFALKWERSLNRYASKIAIEHFLMQADSLGSDSARCYLAYFYKKFHREDKAYELLLKSERTGSKLCKYLLGMFYYDGNAKLNIKRNYARAIVYFLAVEPDCEYYRLACFHLFKCYHYGRGAYKDTSKSMRYLKEAANEKKNVIRFGFYWESFWDGEENAVYLYEILKESIRI